MMLLLAGRIPKEGDTVAWDGWSFEIVDMDRKRVDTVLASGTPVPADIPALLSY
jgi:putative hemolysin